MRMVSDRTKIYYACPDDNTPIGGVKVIYQHVEMLREGGLDARVLHGTPGFRCDWFGHRAKVTASLDPSPENWLVIPEIWADRVDLDTLAGLNIVWFNQSLGGPKGLFVCDRTFPHPSVKGTFVVSATGEAMALELGSRVFHIPNYVPSTFSFRKRKISQVACMPLKGEARLARIVDRITAPVVPIRGLPQAETAKIMMESLVFLHMGEREGFGLPPAEAMRCGCVYVGLSGVSGLEYMRGRSFHFHPGTPDTAIAETVERVLRRHADDPGAYDTMRRSASDFIASTYSRSRTKGALLASWRDLLGAR